MVEFQKMTFNEVKHNKQGQSYMKYHLFMRCLKIRMNVCLLSG